jgi:hypothetical protein
MSQENRSRLIQTWFYDSQLNEIENWRRAQPGIPSRAAAIRNFVSIGLLKASPADTKLPSSKDTAA